MASRVNGKAMLNIQRSSNGEVVFTLSGRIEVEDVSELQRLLDLEPAGLGLALDLLDVTLIDREAVAFLACCEERRIRLENCPAYIRGWMEAEISRSNRDK
jgi:hypothetical protein